MKKAWGIEELAAATSGSVVSMGQRTFEGVGTDTRAALSGQLFVALRGERFDAHEYLNQAVDQGAAVLLVDHWDESRWADLKEKVGVVKVDDTLVALQVFAHHWRKQFKAKVLAISGSNGKTTSKGFAQQVLSTRFKTVASPESFNNHWGVPLTLLSVEPDTEVAVVEMGMNHKGELEHLAAIAQPDVVVITTVGRAHIGQLGSQQAVADAKEELYLASPQAQSIFNIDNEYTLRMYEKARRKNQSALTFSSHLAQADVNLRAETMSFAGLKVSGQIKGVAGVVEVPVFGRQNVNNLMVAASLALSQGMTPEEIWQALPQCQTHWGRNQLVKLTSGTAVLFDAYNANPESMAMLIKNFFEVPCDGHKVAVLGEMLELGEQAPGAHSELGELVGATDIDLVWFIGPHCDDFRAGLERAGFKKTCYFSNRYEQSLANKLGSMLNTQDIAVIKGSRGMALEKVLQSWRPVDFF